MAFESFSRRAALALILAVLPVNGLTAQDREGSVPVIDPRDEVHRVGNRGAGFLELGVGARAQALGGAYTAIAEGVTALYWNPAGVADMPGVAASASYQSLYDDSGLTNSFFGIAVPVGAGAVGLSVIYFSSGDIVRTTERFPEGNDPTAGKFVEWSGVSIGATYARQFTDRLSFGGTLKFADEGINHGRATFYTGDVGIRFNTGLYGVTIGTAITNIGGRTQMEGPAVERDLPATDDPVLPTQRTLPVTLRASSVLPPTAFRFGLRTDLVGGSDAVLRASPDHQVSLMGEMTNPINAPALPGVAVEYGFRELIFLRGSKLFRAEAEAEDDFSSGLAAGFGVRIPGLSRKLTFDYAYQRIELGSSQSISIDFGF